MDLLSHSKLLRGCVATPMNGKGEYVGCCFRMVYVLLESHFYWRCPFLVGIVSS